MRRKLLEIVNRCQNRHWIRTFAWIPDWNSVRWPICCWLHECFAPSAYHAYLHLVRWILPRRRSWGICDICNTRTEVFCVTGTFLWSALESIKHACLWCRMDGDGFFLFKTSGFLKLDPQKIFLRRFEKYFWKKMRSEILDFQSAPQKSSGHTKKLPISCYRCHSWGTW